MRLTLSETRTKLLDTLDLIGLPTSSIQGAAEMILWAEIYHGIGLEFLRRRYHKIQSDPAAVGIISESKTSVAIDAGGQSSLLVGPQVLELIFEKAQKFGEGLGTVKNVHEFAWLGHLAYEASQRGMVSLMSFQASALSSEANDLLALYSQGRTIVSFPNQPAPLWLDMACACDSHAYLMTHGVPTTMSEALQNAFEAISNAPAGFSFVCWPEPSLSSQALKLWGNVLNHASQVGAYILDPYTLHKRLQMAAKHGVRVGTPTNQVQDEPISTLVALNL